MVLQPILGPVNQTLLGFQVHHQGVVQVEHWVAGRLGGEGEAAVGTPALGMLTMRSVGRGGDGVAHTPTLSVNDGVQVPDRIHLLEINEGFDAFKKCAERTKKCPVFFLEDLPGKDRSE